MGRESEAGYSLNPDHTGSTPEDNIPHSPTYSNAQDMQLVPQNHFDNGPILYHPPSFPAPSSSHAPHPSSPQQSQWKRFAIPTKTSSLSSGFPFHPRLYDLKVTHDQWHLFSSSVVSAAKMTGMEDWGAWTTGITAGTLSSPFLLVLAPVVGYYSGKAVHKKTLVKTVKEKLGEEGGLRGVLRRWNEGTWKSMGFQAWLEVPRVSGEVKWEGETETVTLGSKAALKSEKEKKKVEKKAAKRFRIIIVPDNDVEFRNTNGIVELGSASASVEGDSESGSLRSAPGVSTRGGDAEAANLHRETLPPAYWDANDVGRSLSYDGNSNASAGRQQQNEIVSPLERERDREEPLPSEIRYTRVGGFTNS